MLFARLSDAPPRPGLISRASGAGPASQAANDTAGASPAASPPAALATAPGDASTGGAVAVGKEPEAGAGAGVGKGKKPKGKAKTASALPSATADTPRRSNRLTALGDSPRVADPPPVRCARGAEVVVALLGLGVHDAPSRRRAPRVGPGRRQTDAAAVAQGRAVAWEVEEVEGKRTSSRSTSAAAVVAASTAAATAAASSAGVYADARRRL